MALAIEGDGKSTLETVISGEQHEQPILVKSNSHKRWKAQLKKAKRKQRRVLAAKERDAANLKDLDPEESTDSEEERLRLKEEAESQRQHELWLEREKQAQLEFQAKKEKEEKERKKKEETEKKIREEWEARERKEKEEQEEKEKVDKEKRLKQEKLLKEATANENANAWHNPIGPVQYSKERQVEHCPFFKKTAACRFGDQCSRYHDYPESSTTLLIPGMFSSFELEQSVVDSIDTDVSLEYDDNEMYHSFRDFYEDVVPEFKSVGTVVQVKVCCNYEPHLRGNVYVQYKRESAAQEAFQKFNARWYGGRQLTCIFVNIESWKSAICGLAFSKKCPKGKSCNFLHVFRNPVGEFHRMDNDWKQPDRPMSHREGHRSFSQRSHYYRDDRRSESSHSRHSSRVRSSSRYRSRSRSPSRHSSRSRHKRPRSHRDETRSRSKSKSNPRDASPRKNQRRHKYVKNERSRDASRSRSRSGSPDRKSRSRHSTSPSPRKKSSSWTRTSEKGLGNGLSNGKDKSPHTRKESSSHLSQSKKKSSSNLSAAEQGDYYSDQNSSDSDSGTENTLSEGINSKTRVIGRMKKKVVQSSTDSDSGEESFEYVEVTKETLQNSEKE